MTAPKFIDFLPCNLSPVTSHSTLTLMDIQRTVTILLPDDTALRDTLAAFHRVQQTLSPLCFNAGKPLGAFALQRAHYHAVKGVLNAQMTISAMRRVASAYASAARNQQPASRPFVFHRPAATFLIGKRGRDADFRADGTLSIWTTAGRKRLPYTLPEAFRATFEHAREIDALTVIERDGRLLGRVALTLSAPDPVGMHPVGIDLNETNAIVAVDSDGRELFITGKEVKVRNLRTSKTRTRLQRKLATRKAEGRDTRGVRRALKRHGRSRRNRTRTFAQQTAKRLVTWAGADAILVFEDLKRIPQPKRGEIGGKAVRRRLSLWQHGAIRTAVKNKAQEAGLPVVEVDPRFTSQICSRCGLRGSRKRHRFSCSACGFAAHADVNAAVNILRRYTVSRDRGLASCSPEARSSDAGKPSDVALTAHDYTWLAQAASPPPVSRQSQTRGGPVAR